MRLLPKLRQHRLYWPVKLYFKRLIGRELDIRPDVDLDITLRDGWQFSADHLGQNPLVYSLGVGDSIDFDLAMIEEHAATVHAFDPTPDSVEWLADQNLPTRFRFHQWAAAGKDGTLRMVRRTDRKGRKSQMIWARATAAADTEDSIDAPCYLLTSIMRMLGHRHIDLLKVDVEGCEYDIIRTLVTLPRKPKQLLVEFHHRFPDIGPARTTRAIRDLRAAGYRVFAVSETGREVGFIHEGTAATAEPLVVA